ncbi:MAG: hypothetical protein ACMUIP_12870 [bacterium]
MATPVFPTPVVPVPTAPIPTALIPTVPIPTAPIPVVPTPTVPIVTAPLPTVPIPAPVPTITVPTIVAPTIAAPTAAISQLLPLVPLPPFAIAEQVGSWDGVWTNGLYSGPMTLNLALDPLLGTLVGYVQLLGNPYLGSLVDVTGNIVNNQIYISGSGIGLGTMTVTIDIVGTIVDPSTMTGQYTLINVTSIVETGSFDLSLLAPVI